MFTRPERAKYNNSTVKQSVSQIRLKSEKCAACSVFKGFVAYIRNVAALFIDYAVAVQPQSMQPQVFKSLLYNVNNIDVGFALVNEL